MRSSQTCVFLFKFNYWEFVFFLSYKGIPPLIEFIKTTNYRNLNEKCKYFCRQKHRIIYYLFVVLHFYITQTA